METYEQCEDVLFRLKIAWRAGDACGSLERAKSALLDVANILALPDIQRTAVRDSERHELRRSVWLQPAQPPQTASLCTLARKYRVSHKAVRRALALAHQHCTVSS